MTVPHPLFFFSFHRQPEWASDFYVATATSTVCQKSRSVSSADGSRRNADHGATGRRCTLWLRLCAFTRHCIVAGESHSCHVLNRCAMGTSKRHTKLMPTPRAAVTKKTLMNWSETQKWRRRVRDGTREKQNPKTNKKTAIKFVATRRHRLFPARSRFRRQKKKKEPRET